MKPAPFDYVRAESIPHALEALAGAGADADGDASILAGGQTLMPLLALRMATPSVIIDINRIEALAGVSRVAGHNGSGATRIGATTRQNHVLANELVKAHVPALAKATAFVGHHQTRNRGTLGGSVSLGEPAAEYPAIALTLDAVIEAHSSEGIRRIDALDFYLGAYSTALLPDELVVAVEYPDWPADSVTIVHEVTRRAGDFALVGLICQLAIAEGKVSRAAIGWFGMGATPMRSLAAEKALKGVSLGDIDPRAVAELAISETEPLEDKHATAHYRRSVGTKLFTRLLSAAVAERQKP